jgi:proteasome alpha subunit
MPMPFYVAPEQLMKDRSDYAQKGIARGKPVVALEYADGILFIADNPSTHLYKISEIYDRIAFAAVGKYSEFENLRIAGVRLADLRGYSYGREDVTAKSLANAYSQGLANIFTQEMKPYEVELLVAQVGERPEDNELFHILATGGRGPGPQSTPPSPEVPPHRRPRAVHAPKVVISGYSPHPSGGLRFAAFGPPMTGDR